MTEACGPGEGRVAGWAAGRARAGRGPRADGRRCCARLACMETNRQDSPKVAKRRKREMRTISQMVAINCAGNHPAAQRTERAYCGEAVCPECAQTDAYAVERTARCRNMEHKTSCEECGNHCYRPEQREAIRQAMRYAGPRMMWHHPVAAVRHLLGK